jgi:hypothetical protein
MVARDIGITGLRRVALGSVKDSGCGKGLRIFLGRKGLRMV